MIWGTHHHDRARAAGDSCAMAADAARDIDGPPHSHVATSRPGRRSRARGSRVGRGADNATTDTSRQSTARAHVEGCACVRASSITFARSPRAARCSTRAISNRSASRATRASGDPYPYPYPFDTPPLPLPLRCDTPTPSTTHPTPIPSMPHPYPTPTPSTHGGVDKSCRSTGHRNPLALPRVTANLATGGRRDPYPYPCPHPYPYPSYHPCPSAASAVCFGLLRPANRRPLKLRRVIFTRTRLGGWQSRAAGRAEGGRRTAVGRRAGRAVSVRAPEGPGRLEGV
jgi:hypothetical protein